MSDDDPLLLLSSDETPGVYAVSVQRRGELANSLANPLSPSDTNEALHFTVCIFDARLRQYRLARFGRGLEIQECETSDPELQELLHQQLVRQYEGKSPYAVAPRDLRFLVRLIIERGLGS